MAFDFKKEYREFYMPGNQPEIVTVPRAGYIAVRGSGDPNQECGDYQRAVGVLYAVAYTIKMSYKGSRRIEAFSSMWCRLWRASGGRRALWAWIIRTRAALTGFP